MTSRSHNSGFTLLEVLIVTLLLFMLSMALFKSVRDTIQTKADIDQTTETLQGARAALSLMERDLRGAFTVKAEDLGWDAAKAKEVENAGGGGGAGSSLGNATERPDSVTIFQGKSSEVFLSTRTHQRLAQDVPEDNEHFVTYQLSGKDLIRGESARAVSVSDREDTNHFRSFTVLSNVNSVKFSYWNSKNESWLDSWDSENAETKDLLPAAVKIEIEYLPEATDNNRRKIEPVKILTAVTLAQPAIQTVNPSATPLNQPPPPPPPPPPPNQ